MKHILNITILVLLLSLTCGTAFAVEKDAISDNSTPSAISEPTTSAIVYNMEFSKDLKTLSLKDAQETMTTDSPSKALIDMNKKSTLNKGQGHLESVRSFNDLISAGGGPSGTKAQREAERFLRDFANAQAEPNYEAEMNELNLETLKNYFQLKQAEESERIENDNYNLKKLLLENTKKKFEMGTVSNMDVLQAESAVNTARDNLFIAQNQLKIAKMAFNVFMGYPVMQNVSLTDMLEQIELPTKILEISIREALANRNEIVASNFGLNYAKLIFNVFKDYPKSSSKYLDSQLGVIKAEKAQKDTILGIEMEVRNKYITLKQKYDAITSGKKNVENAKELVRLSQLQYDTGMTTLTTIDDAQINLNRAELGLSQNLLNYNLAVAEYNYSSGVGLTPAPIN